MFINISLHHYTLITLLTCPYVIETITLLLTCPYAHTLELHYRHQRH